MSTAPATVHLHIGLHKTGTTYLQNLLKANRAGLRTHGMYFPGGPGETQQAFAVWDLQGRRPRAVQDTRIGGSWDALVSAVNACGAAAALISEEHLSVSTRKQAKRAVASFPGAEVRVVITVRDLARVAVSAWQEEVKNDKTWTWQQFAESIRDPRAVARSPARGFWLRQDLPKICELWEAAVPADRITIVTVPPAPLLLGRRRRRRVADRATGVAQRDGGRGRHRGDPPGQRAARAAAQPAAARQGDQTDGRPAAGDSERAGALRAPGGGASLDHQAGR
jgi:hypothetical protein